MALLEQASMYIHLDPRAESVRVPSSFKNQPQLVLQVGLNMAVAIPDLHVDEQGLSCTLSFNRTPFFCMIPWPAVFALVGENGQAMVWAEDVPAEVAAQAQAQKAPEKPRHHLRSVGESPSAPELAAKAEPAPAAEKKAATKAGSKAASKAGSAKAEAKGALKAGSKPKVEAKSATPKAAKTGTESCEQGVQEPGGGCTREKAGSVARAQAGTRARSPNRVSQKACRETRGRANRHRNGQAEARATALPAGGEIALRPVVQRLSRSRCPRRLGSYRFHRHPRRPLNPAGTATYPCWIRSESRPRSH